MNNELNTEKTEGAKITESLFKTALSNLIINKKIDANKYNDKKYIFNKIREYMNDDENMKWCISIKDEFLDSVYSALKANRIYSSVIMTCTYIENLFNEFFEDILIYKYEFDNKYIRENIFKTINNIDAKIGWFYKMTLNEDFPEELKGRIKNLNVLRNKLIHYKPELIHMDEETNIDKYMKSISKEMIINTLNELEEHLEITRNKIIKENDLVNEIYTNLFNGIDIFNNYEW